MTVLVAPHIEVWEVQHMTAWAVRLTTESGVFALPVWEGLVTQVLAVRGKTALQFAEGRPM